MYELSPLLSCPDPKGHGSVKLSTHHALHIKMPAYLILQIVREKTERDFDRNKSYVLCSSTGGSTLHEDDCIVIGQIVSLRFLVKISTLDRCFEPFPIPYTMI